MKKLRGRGINKCVSVDVYKWISEHIPNRVSELSSISIVSSSSAPTGHLVGYTGTVWFDDSTPDTVLAELVLLFGVTLEDVPDAEKIRIKELSNDQPVGLPSDHNI